jgi:multiple sugar transport system ATP-binding protein
VFKAKIDVLESMGSEYYAYFVVASEQVSSSELEELAADIGGADLPRTQGGVQVTARLGADSQVKQGAEAELWFDSKHLQLFDAESGRSLLAGNGATSATAPAPQPPVA